MPGKRKPAASATNPVGATAGTTTPQQTPKKNRGGRPKGSVNKQKPVAATHRTANFREVGQIASGLIAGYWQQLATGGNDNAAVTKLHENIEGAISGFETYLEGLRGLQSACARITGTPSGRVMRAGGNNS